MARNSKTLIVTAYVRASGPLADGDPAGVLRDYSRKVTEEIAREGVTRLKAFPMDKSGRGTGAFASKVSATSRGDDQVIPGPMEKGVVWSPWLEGSSKRNSSTRFRGYGMFRKTARALNDQAGEIAERVLPEFLPRLGGER